MSYLERLKAEFSEKRLLSEPTKATKAPSVSFVSAQDRRISEIEEREPSLDGGADTRPDPVAEARRQTGEPEVFDFSPPGDLANDDKALAEHKAPALTADERARMLDLAARLEFDAEDIAVMFRQCTQGFEVDGRRYTAAEARLLWLAHAGSVH